MTDFVTIARFTYISEAEAVQLALEHAGIAAYLEGANLAITYSLLSNAIGGIKLQVASTDVVAAEQVLSENQRISRGDSPAAAGSEIVFRCSECGAPIRFAAEMAGMCEVCPRCHKYVDVPDDEAATTRVRAGSPGNDISSRMVSTFSMGARR